MKKYKKYIDDPNYEFVPYASNKKGLGGDIGAGVAGVASGIAGSLLPGQLGSMAVQGINTIHGALDKDITKQEQMISGYGKAAGGIGTAIATGGASLSTGFDDIATGLGQGISNTKGVDPKTGQIVNTVSSLAGLAGGFMGGDATKVADASKLGNVMGNIPMAYGGQIKFNDGGIISSEDPYAYAPQTFEDKTVEQTIPSIQQTIPTYQGKEAPVYEGNFNSAFAEARKAGNEVFTWNNKVYGTKLAEKKQQPSTASTTSLPKLNIPKKKSVKNEELQVSGKVGNIYDSIVSAGSSVYNNVKDSFNVLRTSRSLFVKIA